MCLVKPFYTADELIAALELAREEAKRVSGENCFPEQIILVIDNRPAMKAKRFKKYLADSIFQEVFAGVITRKLLVCWKDFMRARSTSGFIFEKLSGANKSKT